MTTDANESGEWAAPGARLRVTAVDFTDLAAQGRKAPDQRGFQVQPKRWAVERTFSWLTTHRRMAMDYETSPAHSETMIRGAVIGVMVCRLTRGRPATRPGPGSLSRAEAYGLKRGVTEGSPLTS